MSGVTEILNQLDERRPAAAKRLFALVYDELRKLAAAKLAQEKPGQTLQATALVHAAYVRLVGGSTPAHFENRGHLFSAAAEAMRRILTPRWATRLLSKPLGFWEPDYALSLEPGDFARFRAASWRADGICVFGSNDRGRSFFNFL